jgi:hypothetical protein
MSSPVLRSIEAADGAGVVKAPVCVDGTCYI